jgi:hypothetical protein
MGRDERYGRRGANKKSKVKSQNLETMPSLLSRGARHGSL